MKSSSYSPLWILGVGLISLFLSGCKNEVYVTLSGKTGKVILNPHMNDVIHFQKPNTNLAATFLLLSPCKEGAPLTLNSPGMPVTSCTINVSTQTFSRFLYSCPGCQDPEVVVGSDNEKTFLNGAAFRADQTVGMLCTGAPASIAVLPATALEGRVILWEALGDSSSSTYLSDWSITFTGNNPCTGGSISNGSPTCTVMTGAAGATPPTSYAYTISSSHCANPGTGTLSIIK